VLRHRALLGLLGRDLRREDVTRRNKGSAITRTGAQRLEPVLALSRAAENPGPIAGSS
jgi:hypothetical protein